MVLLIVPVDGGCCLALLMVGVAEGAGEGGIRFALASTRPEINLASVHEITK